MGQPAARLGDSTAHGGTIVVGCPTVLIGGVPAARMGDNHVCPMVNPGAPPPPHVGGPILKGSATVMIGGMPAARVGDMCTCSGPPDTIIIGCATVLIGDGGAGGGGGGGGAVKAVRDAAADALTAQSTEATGPHWIEYAFKDKAGNPVSGVKYEFTNVDGSTAMGIIGSDGRVRAGGLPKEGECNVVPFRLYNARWSKEKAKTGDKITLSAQTDGYAAGTKVTMTIYARSGAGIDTLVKEIATQVQGDKIETDWTYDEQAAGAPNAPELYFIAAVGESKTRSSMLTLRADIELITKLPNGDIKGGVKFRVHFENGEVRESATGSNGKAKLADVPAGPYDLAFPEYAGPYDEDRG